MVSAALVLFQKRMLVDLRICFKVEGTVYYEYKLAQRATFSLFPFGNELVKIGQAVEAVKHSI